MVVLRQRRAFSEGYCYNVATIDQFCLQSTEAMPNRNPFINPISSRQNLPRRDSLHYSRSLNGVDRRFLQPIIAIVAALASIHVIGGLLVSMNNRLLSLERSSPITADSQLLLPTQLSPGEMAPLIWRSNLRLVDTDARMMRLPSELTAEVAEFAKRSGLMDAFRMDMDKQDEMYTKILDLPGARGRWTVTVPGRAGTFGNSDIRLFDVLDEDAYEETLQVLGRGGFDIVLEAIGKEFNSEGLMIFGLGFYVLSQSDGEPPHVDLPGIGVDMLDILFPIVLPQQDASQLTILDKETLRNASISHAVDRGLLLSGDTRYATTDCDFGKHGELSVIASVYVADINEENVEYIAEDETSLFPVTNSDQWFMAQEGRAWGRGNSLKGDVGRKPFWPEDLDGRCPELAAAGLCDQEPWDMRPLCPKSCNIFIDNNRYYSDQLFPWNRAN